MSLNRTFVGVALAGSALMTGCANVDPRFMGEVGRIAGNAAGAVVTGVAGATFKGDQRWVAQTVNRAVGPSQLSRLGYVFGQSIGMSQGWCDERTNARANQGFRNGVPTPQSASVGQSVNCRKSSPYGTPDQPIPNWTGPQGQAAHVIGAEVARYTAVDTVNVNGTVYPVVRGLDGKICAVETQPDGTYGFYGLQPAGKDAQNGNLYRQTEGGASRVCRQDTAQGPATNPSYGTVSQPQGQAAGNAGYRVGGYTAIDTLTVDGTVYPIVQGSNNAVCAAEKGQAGTGVNAGLQFVPVQPLGGGNYRVIAPASGKCGPR